MGIVAEYSNSVNRTAEALATQQAADKRLFDKMCQAQDEAFYSRPEWMPEYSIEDDIADIIAGMMGH